MSLQSTSRSKLIQNSFDKKLDSVIINNPSQSKKKSNTLHPIIENDNFQSINEKSPKKLGGRPRKNVSNVQNPTYIEFLSLFGLKNWDDKLTWTQQDLIDNNAISKYFLMRPKLLKLSYPLNDIRKIKMEDSTQFQTKDLITLLNQFARLYGYCVTSYTRDIKPTKTNGLTKKMCYQVYALTKMPTDNTKINDVNAK